VIDAVNRIFAVLTGVKAGRVDELGARLPDRVRSAGERDKLRKTMLTARWQGITVIVVGCM
jgi:hypothetical protein